MNSIEGKGIVGTVSLSAPEGVSKEEKQSFIDEMTHVCFGIINSAFSIQLALVASHEYVRLCMDNPEIPHEVMSQAMEKFMDHQSWKYGDGINICRQAATFGMEHFGEALKEGRIPEKWN